MIEQVPNIFQTHTNHEYPPFNKMIFEEYFMNWYKTNTVKTEYVYLPILWTNFYISRKYGTVVMGDLQKFLDSLDRSKKYFTILQYDDGILQDLKDLDILIFGAGGGGKKTLSERNLGTPIPLLCQPSPRIEQNRDVLCSFVGSTKNHPIRRKIANLFFKNFVIHENGGYDLFINRMERSIFSLCPRGYGATSFRICESLQHGSIPIYVYDKPWIPFQDKFDFNEIGILVSEKQIPDILNIIKSKTKEDIEKYIDNGKRIYEEFFTFEGCAKTIISKL
jgi:hypothetical protein